MIFVREKNSQTKLMGRYITQEMRKHNNINFAINVNVNVNAQEWFAKTPVTESFQKSIRLGPGGHNQLATNSLNSVECRATRACS